MQQPGGTNSQSGISEMLWALATNKLSVTSIMLWPLPTTNYDSLRLKIPTLWDLWSSFGHKMTFLITLAAAFEFWCPMVTKCTWFVLIKITFAAWGRHHLLILKLVTIFLKSQKGYLWPSLWSVLPSDIFAQFGFILEWPSSLRDVLL